MSEIKTVLFESVEDDTPLWVGSFNGSTIEIYERNDTAAEEVYCAPGANQSILDAAQNLAAFLDSAQPEDYQVENNEESGDEVLVSVGGTPWTSFAIEDTGNGLVVVADIQLEDAELDYLQQNGVLPDPDKFGDVTIDMENPDDDFWIPPSGNAVN